VRALADQGVREVVLLGQTVNSYWDQGTPSDPAWRTRLAHLRLTGDDDDDESLLEQQQQQSEHDVAGDVVVTIKEDRGDAISQQYKGYEVAQGFTQRSKPKKASSSDNIDANGDPEGGVRSNLQNCCCMTDPPSHNITFLLTTHFYRHNHLLRLLLLPLLLYRDGVCQVGSFRGASESGCGSGPPTHANSLPGSTPQRLPRRGRYL
jgi:hypothetical protein